MYPYQCKGQQLVLHPGRTIFWEEESALILTDLHIGKTGHFRKSGIAIPQHVYKEDLQRLFSIIQYFKPRQVIITGDLFHSAANQEMELFKKWRTDIGGVHFHLVKGNHDIQHDNWCIQAGIDLSDEELAIGPFHFRHDMNTCENKKVDAPFYFAGHIHPAITIKGMGKQSLRFPCFHFSKQQCTLPAFSHFTGTYTIAPKPGDSIFAIVKDQLMKFA